MSNSNRSLSDTCEVASELAVRMLGKWSDHPQAEGILKDLQKIIEESCETLDGWLRNCDGIVYWAVERADAFVSAEFQMKRVMGLLRQIEKAVSDQEVAHLFEGWFYDLSQNMIDNRYEQNSSCPYKRAIGHTRRDAARDLLQKMRMQHTRVKLMRSGS